MSSDAATHRAAPWRSPLAIVGVAALILVWCALWGSFSFANVASGSVVAVVAAWPVLGQASLAERVRPVALLRLVGPVLADLATSTVHVAWEALTPTDHTQESVIEVPLPSEARAHLLVMVIAITLTPGTAVVDADPDSGVLYLHLLHDDRRSATTRQVERLAALVAAALPAADTSSQTPKEATS